MATTAAGATKAASSTAAVVAGDTELIWAAAASDSSHSLMVWELMTASSLGSGRNHPRDDQSTWTYTASADAGEDAACIP